MNYVGRTKLETYNMTWLDNEIYVIFNDSRRLLAFSDESPFQRSPNSIDIKCLKSAYEMRASVASRSIFITDPRSFGLWRIQMPGSVISHWKIDGIPTLLSISASDEVVVFVCPRNITQDHDGITSANNIFLYIYRAADVARLRIVGIPAEIMGIRRMVASPNGTFIFAYNNGSSLYDLISEVSADGENIIRTFNIGSIKSIKTKDWKPLGLAVVEDGRIFVADNFGHRLFLLNGEMTDFQLLIDHSTVEPWTLCYIKHKQQLIVGEDNHGETRISVLHLSPCEANKRTRFE